MDKAKDNSEKNDKKKAETKSKNLKLRIVRIGSASEFTKGDGIGPLIEGKGWIYSD